jgi:hypothetical protein
MPASCTRWASTGAECAILEAWPVQTLPDPVFARTLRAALTGLLALPEGYPNVHVWNFYIPATREAVARLLRKLTDAGLEDKLRDHGS